MIFTDRDLILVTGASSGIGRATALECVRNGATVIAQGRSRERLADARKECAEPRRWNGVEYDFRDMDGIGDWVGDLASTFGKLRGLVHCAGDGLMDSLRNFSPRAAREHLELNFLAPVQLARAFADRRRRAPGAAIVLTGSAAGLFPEKGHLTYGSAKAALMNAAGSMALELAPEVRVNCVAPGIVETPMQASAERFMGPSYRERLLQEYPLGFGTPEDVANMTVFLLSDKARWITGQNFTLSGGRY